MARVLIIEDDSHFRFLLAFGLKRCGHSIVELARGDTAVDKALEFTKQAAFDVVIIDGWFLPGRRGTEVCRDLKKRPEFCNTPFIMISVEGLGVISAELGDIKLYRFMRKPIAIADVCTAVLGAVSGSDNSNEINNE